MEKQYINWYKEKMGHDPNDIDFKKDEDIIFEDLITGTSYFISKAKYNEIYEAGCKQLSTYIEAGNLEKIEELFHPSQADGGNAFLFPLLPYHNAKEGKTESIRICDHVCLRTAYLYALKYEEIKERDDFESEKEKIRLYGLTWNYGTTEMEFPELEWIEKLLISKEFHDKKFRETKVDVVKGGMIKIKQYYLETNSIPEIRGASLLLDSVNEKKMREVISEEHIRECLVYAGGGKMLGIFPKGAGENICRIMEKLVEQFTVTAQSNFSSSDFSLESLTDDYQGVMDQIELNLEERQGLRWDFRIEPFVTCETEKATYMYVEEEKQKIKYRYLKEKEQKSYICESCRHRCAIAQLKKEPQVRVCQSCLRKNLFGDMEAKNEMLNKYETYLKNRKQLQKPICRDIEVQMLSDIGSSSNGFIGVIYGDANNMSKVIGTVNSLMGMKNFSERTADTVTDIVFEALYEQLKERPVFEIIAVGGDDIFLIVPGKKAFDIACAIGEKFDEQFKNKSTNQCEMTMSLGVCVSHTRMPVLYTFDIAQQLLKSAKIRAAKIAEKRERDPALERVTGTIDIMCIENDVASSSVLKYIRNEEGDKPIKTLRPYTWKQAKAMKKFIQDMGKEYSFAFNQRQSYYLHGEQEAELYYDYQMAKDEKKDRLRSKIVTQALKELASNFGAEANGRNLKIEGNTYTPWLDAVELWDYVE